MRGYLGVRGVRRPPHFGGQRPVWAQLNGVSRKGSPRSGATLQVDDRLAHAQHAGACRVPQSNPRPRRELTDAEGLGQMVVGAGIESSNSSRSIIARSALRVRASLLERGKAEHKK